MLESPNLSARMPKIPGQLSPEEYACIEILAKLVPANGTIVEVGSLLGLSSYAWSKNALPSVTIHCIDPWEDKGGFDQLARSYEQDYSVEQFLKNTKGCDNIRALKGYSPADFLHWERPVDLYFEDAVHCDPILGENLRFWTSKLSTEGILCGPDYWVGFPDVVNWANRLSSELNRTLCGVRSIWCLLPAGLHSTAINQMKQLPGYFEGIQSDRITAKMVPAPNSSEDREVVEKLSKRTASLDLPNCDTSLTSVTLRSGNDHRLTLEGYIVFSGASAAPIVLDGFQCLSVGLRLKNPINGGLITEARSFLKGEHTELDQRIPFRFEAQIGNQQADSFLIEIGMVYEYCYWWSDRGIEPCTLHLNFE